MTDVLSERQQFVLSKKALISFFAKSKIIAVVRGTHELFCATAKNGRFSLFFRMAVICYNENVRGQLMHAVSCGMPYQQ